MKKITLHLSRGNLNKVFHLVNFVTEKSCSLDVLEKMIKRAIKILQSEIILLASLEFRWHISETEFHKSPLNKGLDLLSQGYLRRVIVACKAFSLRFL